MYLHTDVSGAKESEWGSKGGKEKGPNQCWLYLDTVLDTLHMKARFFTESQNGNTRDSSTQGGTPGLN